MDKVTLVRIKRKRSDEPVDAFWLERAPKRLESDALDFGKLSLDESQQKASSSTKVLFRRVDVIKPEDVNNEQVSDSLLVKLSEAEKKLEQRRSDFKRRDRPANRGREHQKEASKNARYKQVWKSRTDAERQDAMESRFHLYDMEKEADEDDELLRKYMPLLKQCMPDEFEKPASDEFVYDLYAQEHDEEAMDEEPDELNTLQVSDYRLVFGLEDVRDSDYDSEDSNREDNPWNDYPDEEGDDEDEESDEDEYRKTGGVDGDSDALNEDDDDEYR